MTMGTDHHIGSVQFGYNAAEFSGRLAIRLNQDFRDYGIIRIRALAESSNVIL